MSDGTSISTKGLISGGSSTPAPGAVIAGPPPTEPIQFTSTTPIGIVQIVVPTAINMVLIAAENITANLLAQQTAGLTLPSLYKRAYMIANETDEIALVKR